MENARRFDPNEAPVHLTLFKAFKKMDMDSISQRLFDADVRIEMLFMTAALSACPSYYFETFVEDELPEEEALFNALPPAVRDCESAEEILSELSSHDHHGFFIQLATPIPRDFRRDCFISSWGHCRTTWIFRRNLGDVAFAAEKFRQEVIAEAKAEAGAALSSTPSINKPSRP